MRQIRGADDDLSPRPAAVPATLVGQPILGDEPPQLFDRPSAARGGALQAQPRVGLVDHLGQAAEPVRRCMRVQS